MGPLPVVRFVGPSGAGKTRLLEGLIPLLQAQGWRVGAVKHHHAGPLALDRPGSDSHRLTTAGAQAVVLSSPEQLVLLTRPEAGDRLAEAVALLANRVDLILVEGYRQASGPVVLVPGPAGDCPPFQGEVLAVYWPPARGAPRGLAAGPWPRVATPEDLVAMLRPWLAR